MAITKVGSPSVAPVQEGSQTISEGKGKEKPRTSNVIVLEETVIEGRVHKPEAFYILQRSSLNYNALAPKETFIPRILDSVKRNPF